MLLQEQIEQLVFEFWDDIHSCSLRCIALTLCKQKISIKKFLNLFKKDRILLLSRWQRNTENQNFSKGMEEDIQRSMLLLLRHLRPLSLVKFHKVSSHISLIAMLRMLLRSKLLLKIPISKYFLNKKVKILEKYGFRLEIMMDQFSI